MKEFRQNWSQYICALLNSTGSLFIKSFMILSHSWFIQGSDATPRSFIVSKDKKVIRARRHEEYFISNTIERCYVWNLYRTGCPLQLRCSHSRIVPVSDVANLLHYITLLHTVKYRNRIPCYNNILPTLRAHWSL